jgi:serine/threonine protein kinase
MPLTSGTRVGPYEIVSAIGAGGMGEVYRARDTRLDRIVAVKILNPALAADPQFRERFEREARTLSRIEHPHICALYDVGEHDGAAYLVMQYLEGETLAERLARGPVPVRDALKVAREILDALAAAHHHGVIHRDLKPGNVMLTKTGARLLDFGLAKPATAVAMTDATVAGSSGGATQQGTILGTLHYMSPEQLRGRPLDARSDIFAAGVVLYEMVAGSRPFEGPDGASVISAILARPAPPLATALPAPLTRAIHTALEKDPDDRWQTCRDFARELAWIAQELSAPASAAAVTPLPTRRRSRRGWIAAAVLLLAAGAAVPLSLTWNRPTAVSGRAVAILMDSSHPQRVYDAATLKAGGTNADDLTDVLRDLPLSLVKETTGTSWHREDQILAENPELVLVHRSCFYDATMLDSPALDEKYFEQLYAPAADKLEMLLGYLALGNSRTRFVVYSRGSWKTESERDAWVAAVERRFPRIAGRLTAYKVPLDRATFRHSQTAADMKAIVSGLLAAPSK